MSEPTAGAAPRSIAILPFVDLSRERDQEYLGDGLAEEILNVLGQIDGLHVPARTSAFAFKGRNVDVREIGRQLGVETVLEGSVRTAGERLRVTAQLIDVADGYHLWSRRFDRSVADVFAVEDEIAAEIAAALHVEEPAVGVSARAASESLEGYYFHGRSRYAAGDLEAAAVLWRKALEIRPESYETWALLAPVLREVGREEEMIEAARRTVETAERALDLGFAHGDWVRNDPDLVPLRGRMRFQRVLERLRQAQSGPDHLR